MQVDKDDWALAPQVLPGGKYVMFTLAKNNGTRDRFDTAQIVVQSLASGERRTLIRNGSDARYLPTGHIVYAVASTVYGVAFDLATLTVRGEAVPVLTGFVGPFRLASARRRSLRRRATGHSSTCLVH